MLAYPTSGAQEMRYKRLTNANVNCSVPKNATGVYFLGYKRNRDFHIKYIGRSDTRLRSRLIDHARNDNEDYTHFSFQITKTILEAYRIECREWHNAVDLDNRVHPRKPRNLDYCCPYCRKSKGGYKEWAMKSKE